MDILLLFGIALLVFGSAATGELLFDDYSGILADKAVQDGRWKELLRTSWWRRILRASYAFSANRWGGRNVLAFHLTNLLMHATNASIVYAILNRLGVEPVYQMLGAIVFLVEPMSANAVASISGRSSVLSSTFAFLAILAVVSGYPLLALPFVPLAYMTKEDMVILPATLGAISGILGQPFWWAWFVIPGAVALVERRAIGQLLLNQCTGHRAMQEMGFTFGALPQPAHAITVFTETVLRYPRWAVGVDTCPDPEIHEVSWRSKKFVAACGLVAIAAAAFLLIPDPLFRIALALIVLSPLAVYVAAPTPDVVTNYRAYGSLPGVALLAVVLAQNAPPLLWAGGIAYLAIRCAYNAYVWSSSTELWNYTLRTGGKKQRALVNLGVGYKLAGDFVSAGKYYQEALALNPKLGIALINMAWIEHDIAFMPQLNPAEKPLRLQRALEFTNEAVKHCPQFQQAIDLKKQIETAIEALKPKPYPLSQTKRQMAEFVSTR